MKRIQLIALSMVLVLAYNCKDAKKAEKEGQSATDEPVQEIAEEANIEVINFPWNRKATAMCRVKLFLQKKTEQCQ